MHTHRTVFLLTSFEALLLFIGSPLAAYCQDELESNEKVVVPAWVPTYDDIYHVRYYYFPDIEVFYDVWNQEFVYLQDGDWMFASSLPPMYSGFDLYNCFIVVLNRRVYEPWMHFHHYIAHYPRYYYYSVYNITDTHELRGFNENRKVEIRLKPEEMSKLDEASRNRPERERVIARPPEQRNSPTTRPRQRMKYYGQDVGKPVKVEKQMMKPRKRSEEPK